MKLFGASMVLLSLFSLVSACSAEPLPNARRTIIKNNQVSNNAVLPTDIQNHIDYSGKASTKSSYCSVDAIVSEEDTVMYLVNYNEGWELISADKRTPAIIAWSEKGNINIDKDNGPLDVWLKLTAKDLLRVKRSNNKELSFSADEIQKNLNYWKRIELSLGKGPIIEGYDVWDSLYYSEMVSQIMHMVPAHWDQNAPYNVYCPTMLNGNHYYTGCASVAGGGMLHFLYKKNGYPSSFHNIPLDSVGVNYTSVLYDSTMVTARYIKAINDEVNAMYTSSGTAAFPLDVVDFFDSAGYDCSYSAFNAQTVKNSLLAGNPVLMLAFDDIAGLTNIFHGHYFIIDGYQMRHDVFAIHHYTVSPSGLIIPNSEHTFIVSIGPPYLAFVKMNWGWYSQWTEQEDDGWFALTASWSTSEGDYDMDRYMFYNFQ